MRPDPTPLLLLALVPLLGCPPSLRGGTPPVEPADDDDDATSWDDDDATSWDDDDIWWDDDDVPGSWLSVWPERLDFGAVPVGEESWQSVELYNQGDRDISIYELFSEGSESWLLVMEQEPLILPWSSLFFDVGFAPREPGPSETTIYVSSDADNGSVWVSAEGEGVEALLRSPGAEGPPAPVGP